MTKTEAINQLLEAIKWHDSRKHGKSWARVKEAATVLDGLISRKNDTSSEINT